MSDERTSEQKNIKIGIYISYITLAISIFGAIFITPRILNNLGDEQYGLYSFATSITSWFTVISSALASSYIKFATEEAKNRSSVSKTNLIYFKIFIVCSIGLMVLLLAVTAVFYFGNIRLSQYSVWENKLILLLLLISGFQISVQLFFSAFEYFITYSRKFIFSKLMTLIVALLTYCSNLVIAITTKSVAFVAIGTLGVTIFSVAANVWFCVRKQKISFEKSEPKSSSVLIRSIIIFSSFIILNSIVDRINNEVDKTILGIMVNSKTVTIYTLSKTFNSYLLALSVSISGMFAPRIHEYVSKGMTKEINELFIKVSTTQLMILCLVVGGFISCGKDFVLLWLGGERIMVYYHAIPFLILDIIAFSCNFCIEVQRAMNKHKFRAFLYVALAMVNVGLSILFVYIMPKENAIWGVTIGTVVSIVAGNWIILNIYNQKIIGLPMKRYFFIALKYIVMTSICAGISYVFTTFVLNKIDRTFIRMILSGVLFIILYASSVVIADRKSFVFLLKKVFKKS